MSKTAMNEMPRPMPNLAAKVGGASPTKEDMIDSVLRRKLDSHQISTLARIYLPFIPVGAVVVLIVSKI